MEEQLEKLNKTDERDFKIVNKKRSWLSLLCKKRQQSDAETSWEPSFWSTHCSSSICPTYKRFANILSIVLIGLLLWGITYTIIPNLVKPGGKLFDLVILTGCAYLGGKALFNLTSLPGLIGMLLIGILFQNVGFINLQGEFSLVTSELRKIALVIILTRAGLSLDQPTMKKLYIGVLKLGFIPWIVECVTIGILGHYLLGLPWSWAFLLSCIIASVSPAVVVPCFLRLQIKGYGVDKGIPTLILASAAIDDTTSIAVYGIISSIMFTESSLINNILQGPISIVGGIAFGVIWGYLVNYIPEKTDSFVAHLRVLLLFLGGYISVVGSTFMGYAGAGPLAVITAAFVSGYNWSKQGWDVKINPATSAFRSSWIVFEPILFGLTGTLIKLNELDPHIVGVGAGCLITGVVIRILITAVVCFGSNFNAKEKLFIGLSWMAKATVQAALGPLALESVKNISGTKEEMEYAKTLLMICILSIILTAPLGAILISITGPRLLSKSQLVETPNNKRTGEAIKDNSNNIETGANKFVEISLDDVPISVL